MADDPNPDPKPDPKPDPNPDPDPDPKPDPKPDDLGAGGKAALDAERKARRDAEKAAREAQAKLDALEAEKLSEAEREKKRADDAEAKVSTATERLRRANLMTALADEGVIGAKAKAAARLLDSVEYDDHDEPTNLADAVKVAKAEYGDDVFKPNGRVAGDADGGKGSPDSDVNVTPGLGRLMHAYSKPT